MQSHGRRRGDRAPLRGDTTAGIGRCRVARDVVEDFGEIRRPATLLLHEDATEVLAHRLGHLGLGLLQAPAGAGELV